MQNCLRVVLALAFGGIVAAQSPAPASPDWAYGFPPLAPGESPATAGPAASPAVPPRQPDTTLKRIPGSSQAFTLDHIRDYWDVGDWFPDDHPPMPNVVVHGRQPHVRGCAMCHMPNGKGRPENAPVAGLPEAYIVQQLMDFKNDLRASADPRKLNTAQMIEAAKDMTDEEVQAAARYFSSIEVDAMDPRRRSRDRAEDAALGQRLHSGTRGRDGAHRRSHHRVTGGCGAVRAARPAFGLRGLRAPRQPREGGRARRERRRQDTPCGICHGTDLKGLGPVPGIAGRLPAISCGSSTTSNKARARARGHR
jgi:cytochrome c553